MKYRFPYMKITCGDDDESYIVRIFVTKSLLVLPATEYPDSYDFYSGFGWFANMNHFHTNYDDEDFFHQIEVHVPDIKPGTMFSHHYFSNGKPTTMNPHEMSTVKDVRLSVRKASSEFDICVWAFPCVDKNRELGILETLKRNNKFYDDRMATWYLTERSLTVDELNALYERMVGIFEAEAVVKLIWELLNVDFILPAIRNRNRKQLNDNKDKAPKVPVSMLSEYFL